MIPAHHPGNGPGTCGTGDGTLSRPRPGHTAATPLTSTNHYQQRPRCPETPGLSQYKPFNPKSRNIHTCQKDAPDAGVGKSALALWLATNRKYACHFTSSPGGRDPSVASRNIAAQLIIMFNLMDFAPGGTLPVGAGDSNWLYKVIAAAAHHQESAAPGLPVVIVVDGLDEADSGSSGTPLGLPVTLPKGIFIVATLRTGTPLRWLREEQTATFRIISNGDNNLNDMNRYLQAAVKEPEIRAAVDSNGITTEWLIEKLLDRCGGVWIYLHYILQEIRSAKRKPTFLDQLPRALSGYYTENINALRADPQLWDTFYLKMLAVLAVAQEPLTPVMVRSLANISNPTSEIRRFLTETWRPFCVTVADGKYRLYHESLRDYLSGMIALGIDSAAEYITNDRLELGQASQDAHRQIANRYLSAWGSLDDGLPTLMRDVTAASLDDSYGLRHLPLHMEVGLGDDYVHRLLACEHSGSSGGYISNVWYFTHDRVGSIDTYLTHLSRAAALARDATGRARQTGMLAPSIGTEVYYALVRASITSLAVNFPSNLIAALLAGGVWEPVQALIHARNNPDPIARAKVYASIAPYITGADRSTVMDTALENTQVIPGERARALALVAIIPHLSEVQLSAALDTARLIRSERARARVLSAFVPYLADSERSAVLNDALQTARTIRDEADRARAMAALVPHLPQHDRQTVLNNILELASTIPNASVQVRVLEDINEYLTPEMLAEALQNLRAIKDRLLQVKGFTALIPCLKRARANVLAEALSTAITISDDKSRVLALAALLPHLRGTERANALKDAQEGALRINDRPTKVYALAVLLPYLTESEQVTTLDNALETVKAISGQPARAHALATLAPYLPLQLVETALEIADDISYHPARVTALDGLAPHLPVRYLPTALIMAQAINDKPAQVRALAALVGFVIDTDQPTALNMAVRTAEEIRGPQMRLQALAEIVSFLPDGDRTRVLSSALKDINKIRGQSAQVQALSALIPYVPLSLSDELWHTVHSFTDNQAQADALTAIAPYLPPTKAHAALKQVREINYQPARTQALIAIIDSLPIELLEDALEIATSLSSMPAKAQALAALAPRLPDTLLPGALEEALSITSRPARARALTLLAQCMAGDRRLTVLGSALETAEVITDDATRVQALAELIPLLPDSERSRVLATALKIVQSISDARRRAQAVAALVPLLPETERLTMVEATLGLSRTIGGDSARSLVLVMLVPLFPAEKLDAILEEVRSLSSKRAKVRVLSALAPYLKPRLLVEALKIAQEISYQPTRVRALSALAEHLDSLDDTGFPEMAEEIRVAGLLNELYRGGALHILHAAGSQVYRLGGSEAVAASYWAVINVARWWP